MVLTMRHSLAMKYSNVIKMLVKQLRSGDALSLGCHGVMSMHSLFVKFTPASPTFLQIVIVRLDISVLISWNDWSHFQNCSQHLGRRVVERILTSNQEYMAIHPSWYWVSPVIVPGSTQWLESLVLLVAALKNNPDMADSYSVSSLKCVLLVILSVILPNCICLLLLSSLSILIVNQWASQESDRWGEFVKSQTFISMFELA